MRREEGFCPRLCPGVEALREVCATQLISSVNLSLSQLFWSACPPPAQFRMFLTVLEWQTIPDKDPAWMMANAAFVLTRTTKDASWTTQKCVVPVVFSKHEAHLP